MKSLNICVIFVLIVCNLLNAQDIHFTNFDLMPASFNPAWNHAVYNDLNAGLIYRNQSFTVTPHSFSSYGAYFQSKLIKKVRTADRLNIHGLFLSDQSGSGKLSSNAGKLGLSYHISLDNSLDHVLSIGIQGGFNQIRIGDLKALSFEEDLLGGSFSEGFKNENAQHLLWAVGMHHRSQLNDKLEVQLGTSLSSKQYLSQDPVEDEKTQKLALQFSFEQYINTSFSIAPRVYYQSLKNAENLMVHLIGNYQLNTENFIKLQFGAGIRYQDAAQILLGAELSNWKIGLSYDVNTSALAQASTYASGIEMAVLYKYDFPKRAQKLIKKKPLDLKKKKNNDVKKEPIISLALEVYEDESSLFETNFEFIQQSISDTSFQQADPDQYQFSKALVKDRRYHLILKKVGYISDTSYVSTYNIKADSIIQRVVHLSKTPKIAPIKVVRGEPARLNSIYYNLDDYKILPESVDQLEVLYRAMLTYPEMEIEISSHTDAQGEDAYNLNLSTLRATSVTNWLESKGIVSKRLTPKGYGESKLINHCKNGVQCSDEEHRENRRTEFKILKGPDVIYLQ